MKSSSYDSVDYYDALYGRTRTVVELKCGERLELRRAGLGRHFALQHQRQRIVESEGLDKLKALRSWFCLAGVEDEAPTDVSDLATLANEIENLNAPRGQPAWTIVRERKERKERRSDYSGRDLGHIVHLLAYHYGWTADYILELPPEMVFAHLQECILSERSDREWLYYLSEVSWSYDKITGRSRFRPLPPIEWDAELFQQRQYKPIPEHIKERYFPKGVIIDLTDPDAIAQLRQAGSSHTDNEPPGHTAAAPSVAAQGDS